MRLARTAVLKRPASRTQVSSLGVSEISTRSRHESDTVYFLQCGFALFHRVQSRLAQQTGTRAMRSLFEVAYGSARGNQFAQFVVQYHQFGDRFAALVARSAAFAAAAADTKLVLRRF